MKFFASSRLYEGADHPCALAAAFCVFAVCAFARERPVCAVPVGVELEGRVGAPSPTTQRTVGEADERISLSVYVYF